jgi:hypothetical protein
VTPKDKAVREVEDMAVKLFADPNIAKSHPQVFSGVVETLTGVELGQLFDRAASGDANADWALRYEAATLLVAGQSLAPPKPGSEARQAREAGR